MAGRKHTLEERVRAVREHLEDGKNFSELSARYGVTAQVVRNWVSGIRRWAWRVWRTGEGSV